MKKSVLVVVAVVATLVAAPLSRADTGVEYYLSLGDSLAQGYQPDQLFKLVRDRYQHLALVKLGCGGETTTTMIVGSPWCGSGFAAGSQLAEAKAFLQAHRAEVAFVTLDIGGNDLTSPDGGGVAAVQANLPKILAQLREEAGPEVPIVGMNYYHPFLPDIWFGTHDPAALQGAVEAIVAFNDVLASLYAAAGDPMADVESGFSTSEVGDGDGDGVPDNVAQACTWTWRCTPPPHGPDIHPNSAGYGAIADAFESALGP